MDQDPRVEELTNLRLALGTFALQLDAFEARLKGRSPKTTLKAFHPAPPDISVANKIVAATESQPQFAGIGRGCADPDFQDFAPSRSFRGIRTHERGAGDAI